MGVLFWLSDEPWAAIEPRLPKNQPGARRSASGGKGGPSAGERPFARRSDDKIHALTDTVGRPFALTLTPGNVSDIAVAPALPALPARAVPVIPGRSTRKRRIVFNHARYRERHRIQNAFCRIKDFRRVATRYDKLAANFLSALALAVLLACWI